MISSQPEPAALIHHQVPHQQVVRQGRHAFQTKKLIDGVIPLLLLLVVHITLTIGKDKEVAVVVDNRPVLRILITPAALHVVVFPNHAPLAAIDTHQFTITRSYYQQTVIFSKRGEPEVFGELVFIIAVLDQRLLLRLGIIAIEAVVVVLHPEILLRVDIDTVNTARDADFGEFGRRIAYSALRLRVENAEVHTLAQPQPAIDILPDHIDIVVA